MTTIFDGLFTDILDDLKTYLGTTLVAKYPRVFFGPIDESVFFSINKPAVSIQLMGATEDPKTARGWIMDVSVIYLMYDPSFTDDYDVIDKIEVLMDDIHTHMEAQNIAGKRMYGDVVGMNPYRFDHEDSYVFMGEVKVRIYRKEA